MIEFELLHPRMSQERLGLIPMFFSEDDPRPAREQLDDRYRHGGGYSPFGEDEWKLNRDSLVLKYPEGSPLRPMAKAKLRGELLVVYEYALLAIIQPDGSFKVTRVD